jgi:hypothetical protein
LLSELQDVGQERLEPLHTYGAQAGLPGLPELEVMQLPVEQLPQGPHALLQQMLPTQLPEMHALLAEQACPSAALGVQTVPLQ